MYALRVRINDQPPVVAGADDLGILNAIVNCVGKLASAAVPHHQDETQDFFVNVGGLTSRSSGSTDEHLSWLSQVALRPGDKVTVEIIETQVTDPVISGVEAEKRLSDEREYFEHCKQAYFAMRNKYEPET